MQYKNKLSDIHIRDPFVLCDEGKYYMYGTRGKTAWGRACGFDVFVSCDLENWTDATEVFTPPKDFWSNLHFWAPEVHKYRGRYYMFASFNSDTRCRGTQILVSDSPMGPFTVHSDGPVTPADWLCLDGTLYVEDGVPYMVFCHEWVQTHDGEMCAVQLNEDLSAPVGEPFLLFTASSCDFVTAIDDKGNYVTDGPFFHKLASGKNIMIWSSFTGVKEYCEIISYSKNGKIRGEWVHQKNALFDKNGGHGMIFKSYEDKLHFIMHTPNKHPEERPALFELRETDDSVVIAK